MSQNTAPTTENHPWWALFLVQKRIPLLLVLGVLTLASAWQARLLQFNFSPDNIFVIDDPIATFYDEKLRPAFGHDANTVVVVVDGDLQKPKTQQLVARLHGQLQSVPAVERVRSLVSAQLAGMGGLGSVPLFDGEKANVTALQAAAKDPMMRRLLVDEKLQLTPVTCTLHDTHGKEAERDEAVAAITAIVDKVVADVDAEAKVHMAGVPKSHEIIVGTLKSEQIRYVPLVVLVMGLFLFGCFRNGRGVVLPFVATGCAAVWCVGGMATVGHTINVVNNAIIILLLVVGIADAVHLLFRYEDEAQDAYERHGDDVDKEDVLVRTVAHMALPCLLTTSTTAVGFLAALVADIHLVRQFGTDAALGVMGAFFATMVVVPGLLGFLPLPRRQMVRVERFAHLRTGLLWVADVSLKNRALLIVGGAVVTAACLALSMRITATQTLLSELPDDAETVAMTHALEEKLVGVLPFNVAYELDELQSPEVMWSPDVLREMSRVLHLLETTPLDPARPTLQVVARGLPNVLESVAHALNPDDTTRLKDWDDAKIAQMKMLFDLADDAQKKAATENFITDDGRLCRIMAFSPDIGTQFFLPYLDVLVADVHDVDVDGGHVKAVVTGGQVTASMALITVEEDLASSVVLALLFILVFVTALFRSLKMGLIALAPNALPVVATLAAMGLLDVPLRLATVLVFPMAIGVAVDASIHLLSRFRHEQHGGRDVDDALRETVDGAGRPVVVSTVLLLCGFLVLGLSRFQALHDFAVLSAATMTSALVVDLLVLPALMSAFLPSKVLPSKVLGAGEAKGESDDAVSAD